jgi:hypothetical protein
MNPVRLLSKLSKPLSPKVDPRIQDKAIEIVAPPMKNGRGITKLFPPQDTLELSAYKAYQEKQKSRLRLCLEGYLGATIVAFGLGLVNGQYAVPFATAMGGLATYTGAMALTTRRNLKTLEESIKGYKFSVERNDKIAVLDKLPTFRTPVPEASIEYYDLTHGDFKEAAYKNIPKSNLVQGSIQDGYYFSAGTDLTRYPVALQKGESRTYTIPGYGEITLQHGEHGDAFVGEWNKIVSSGSTIATKEEAIKLLQNPVISGNQFDYGAADLEAFDQKIQNIKTS